MYLKHRDVFARRIASMKDEPFGIRVVNNDGSVTCCVVSPAVAAIGADLLVADAKKSVVIVTLSNEDNFKATQARWRELCVSPHVLMVFVNPKSFGDDKWILKPHLHDKVCDRSSLIRGLRGMAELVEPVTAAVLES